ncbi:MAG: hypothetical protein Ct9H300mP28_33600 [Pseudomonadota bacterium]|nr:MAG: hypothetical protein Ct9H300mP28_33600 [Pseudomonadota bacterium]
MLLFTHPFIRPIDHLYNLNRFKNHLFEQLKPESKSDVHLSNQFFNILNKWNIRANPKRAENPFKHAK